MSETPATPVTRARARSQHTAPRRTPLVLRILVGAAWCILGAFLYVTSVGVWDKTVPPQVTWLAIAIMVLISLFVWTRRDPDPPHAE
ncbi:hypothetical protein [Haematomicrobium sanguinis]|uniref:hypothetical protein n=1 Tax=Haematomicrobium sanguinis TaxID=479106 RepID=UPI00047D7C8C|nr:hypothetical protein [Haematomicrobium sanguinis]